jgi:hypothetical protein
MKKVVFVFIIFCFVQSAFAQGDAPLTQAEYVKMLYSLQKDPGGKAAIVEALRKRGIAFVLTDGVRGLTRSKGANDDELKRALEAAERRRQNPAGAALPSVKDAGELIEAARRNTLDAIVEMPDFVVKQLISRSGAYAGTGSWKPYDNLAVGVSYSTEKGEQYRVLAVNGARVDAEKGSNYAGLGGATTRGEFVEDLQRIFRPESKTEFRPIDTDLVRDRNCIVFEYVIKIENNKGTGLAFGSQSYQMISAGEIGKVWIDRLDKRVLRIEAHSTDIPANFPIRAFQTVNDYDWVTIGSERYLLPSQTDLRFTSKMSVGLVEDRNVIRFRNYQKYGSEVKILDEDMVPEPVKPD